MNKSRLHRTEMLCWCGVIGCLSAALLAKRWPEQSHLLAIPAMIALTLAMVAFMIAGGVFRECVAALHGPATSGDDGPGLTPGQFLLMLQWSPKPHKYVAVAGIALIVLTAFFYGAISWSTSQPFTEPQAIGAMLYLSGLFALPLPELASVARMPGTFSDNIAQLKNKH